MDDHKKIVVKVTIDKPTLTVEPAVEKSDEQKDGDKSE